MSDPRISSKIAEKMSSIHSLNIPVSKEPEWLWKTMERWLVNVESNLATFKSDKPTEMLHSAEMQKIDFRKEVNWLKDTIEKEDFPIVFSHNDLQEGNILFKEGNQLTPDTPIEQMRYILLFTIL